MPDIVMHNAMGDKVLQKLSTEITTIIDYEIFRYALMGPDPYQFYRFFLPPLRHGVNKRSHIMHTTKTGLFLMELAARSQSREVFSFLAGFLCHYAMDSISHPFICKMANSQGSMHTAIEHKLDVLELERQGKQRKDIVRLFAKCPDLPEVREVIQKVYGWNDNCYAVGAKYMHLYYWIAKDQHGILNCVLHWMPGKLSSVSYRTKIADKLELAGFTDLERNAVERGVQLITAVYEYRNGDICEECLRKIIGNHSYVEAESEGNITSE